MKKPNARSSQQDTGQDSYKVKAGGEEAECTAKEKNQHTGKLLDKNWYH